MSGINFNGIDEIRVKGYKSIKNEAISLRPITILAGANSSGKSSIMQPLLLLKQTLEEKNPAISLLLPGKNVYLTQYDQIRPKFKMNENVEFEIGLKNSMLWAYSTFQPAQIFQHKDKGNRLLISKSHFDFSPLVKEQNDTRFEKVQFTLFPGMSSGDIHEKVIKICHDKFLDIDNKKIYTLKEESCFLAIQAERPKEPLKLPGNPHNSFRFAGSFSNDILGIIHLSGLRGDPTQRTFQRCPITSFPSENGAPTYFFKGKFSGYTASLIEEWEQEDNSRRAKLIEYVQKMGLSTTVATKSVDDSFLEIFVGWHPSEKPMGTNDMVHIADVGCGVSQALPILVALIAAKEKQIVYIEQPEIHLHPKASVALADIIANAITDAARRGVRVVIETHSDIILLALQTHVAQHINGNGLKPEDVVLYWFEKQSDGTTKIKEGHMDGYGDYADWSEDFTDVRMQAQRKYLDAYFVQKNKEAENYLTGAEH